MRVKCVTHRGVTTTARWSAPINGTESERVGTLRSHIICSQRVFSPRLLFEWSANDRLLAFLRVSFSLSRLSRSRLLFRRMVNRKHCRYRCHRRSFCYQLTPTSNIRNWRRWNKQNNKYTILKLTIGPSVVLFMNVNVPSALRRGTEMKIAYILSGEVTVRLDATKWKANDSLERLTGEYGEKRIYWFHYFRIRNEYELSFPGLYQFALVSASLRLETRASNDLREDLGSPRPLDAEMQMTGMEIKTRSLIKEAGERGEADRNNKSERRESLKRSFRVTLWLRDKCYRTSAARGAGSAAEGDWFDLDWALNDYPDDNWIRRRSALLIAPRPAHSIESSNESEMSLGSDRFAASSSLSAISEQIRTTSMN